MAREDHYGMDDGEKATCLYNVRVLKQEGWIERKGLSVKSWREWWDWWKRL